MRYPHGPPLRSQALRATLDWSHRLLSQAERVMFRRPAVFAESCSLEAMEDVCADGDGSRGDVLDIVTRLVDRSLVIVERRGGQARYRLLEPVRQYAHELLAANGELKRVRRRHALYFEAFAAPRGNVTNTGGPRRFAAMNELGGEYANLRSARAWSWETGESQVSLSIGEEPGNRV